ncbi:MAG: reverse transcriptase [Candidatus Aenigmarchaeota archaeon]|nr:reverse transcriptase [Candidatus Aenigmarchaeota archaeon]
MPEKVYKDLYSRLCSFENLYLAYKKTRRNKRHKKSVQEFGFCLEKNLFQLTQELETLTYSPKPLRRFVIRDPKSRIIRASVFRDRVVHHALINILQPIFEPTFIHDSFANQKGKETHKALKRFDKFKRKVSENGRLVENTEYSNQTIGYILKADIKH